MGKIIYDKLFKLMKEKGLTTYEIKKYSIISESTLQSIRHNKGISTDTIGKLCEALDCQPGDIMEYKKDV
jgi:putative transcriptional regulator